VVLVPLVAASWVVVHTTDMPLDWRPMTAWTAALLSHLILDVLCAGPVLGRQGHGIPLLWPLTRRRWFVRRPVVPEANLPDRFTPGLIFRACLWELVHLGPTAGALLVLRHLL